MRRIVLIAAVVVASVPALASAEQDVGEKDNGLSICEEQYLKMWDQVLKEKVGPYNGAAGRNVVQDGVETKDGIRPASDAECEDGVAVMDRMLNPVPVAPEATTTEVAPTEAAPASYGSSGTSWDAVAACESGGDWSINTGNGYYGGLQFDSGTWDAYGDPAYAEASDAPMEAQIAAAESMPYDGWPNC